MKIVVIGAGIAGLAIAWKLAAEGCEVTVIERGAVGAGASTVAAGMIAPVAEYGASQTAEASFARKSSQLWLDFAKRIEADSGLDIGYDICGAVLAALTEAEKGELCRSYPALPWWDGPALQAREPVLAPMSGAVWAEGEAQVDTPRLMAALAKAAQRRGAILRLFETARRLRVEKDRAVGIETAAGFIAADKVVLAAGAWSSRLEGVPPAALPPVHPVKGETLVLVQPRGRALPSALIWGNGIYLVPRREGLLVGATVEWAGHDDRPTARGAAWLIRQASALVPGVEEWRRGAHRASLRPASPDGAPIVGMSALPGLVIASGQYRNGILFAPMLTEVACGAVSGQANDPAFDPQRFSGDETPDETLVRPTAHVTAR